MKVNDKEVEAVKVDCGLPSPYKDKIKARLSARAPRGCVLLYFGLRNVPC